MPEMQAAVLHAVGGPLAIERVHLPPPGPGEVLVRMAAAGVCHSDLHVIKGELRQKLPVVLGHEGAGIVEAIGEGVTTVSPGMAVVMVWVPGCGTCWYCTHDQAHLCDNGDPLSANPRLSLDGQPVQHFLSAATFAEYALVPESGVVSIPTTIPLQTAALLSCGVVTGVGAVIHAARVPRGATVAVFGCGGVGLNVVQGARLAGAEMIVAIDTVPAKLETARTFGATHTLDASQAGMDLVAALRDLSGGRGMDYCFEAVGNVGLAKIALSATRKGGTLVMVGLPPVSDQVEVRGVSLVLHDKTIRGSFYGSASPRTHIPRLLDLYAQGDLLLDELLSHRFRLDEINTAFEALGRGELLRGMIVFDG